MSIAKNPSYILADIILSKKSQFTFEEILEELREAGVEKSQDELKKAFQRLQDNGIIIKCGSQYLVYRDQILGG